MSPSSFPDQVQRSLVVVCGLFASCIQRYALQCSTDGHFAQLIFGADLARAFRSGSHCDCPPAIIELLVKHLVTFEEQLGSHVKTLAFFVRDLLIDRTVQQMSNGERRRHLSSIRDQLSLLEYPLARTSIAKKEELNVESLVDLILNTFPREILDRHGVYRDLLVRLVKHNLDRVDDYLSYREQLSFVATGSSIDQSRLIDGILLPIHNANKLLPSFSSKSQYNLVCLNLSSSSDTSFSIFDEHQRFFSYDTSVYRQFISKHLVDVQLIVSSALIDPIFVFELHRANINIIDTLDDQTFEFVLQVYRCVPCNRLFLADDETIDKRSAVLIDRYVIVNEQAYIYLSSNGAHQTLLTCVPTPTLVLTTEKILINLLRLIKFVEQKLNQTPSLPMDTEQNYLRYIERVIPELRGVLACRRIHLDRMATSSEHLHCYPVCIFHEYLLNGIDFLCYVHRIDGVYSTKRNAEGSGGPC